MNETLPRTKGLGGCVLKSLIIIAVVFAVIVFVGVIAPSLLLSLNP